MGCQPYNLLVRKRFVNRATLFLLYNFIGLIACFLANIIANFYSYALLKILQTI